jgi:hypothetical protein
MPGQGNSYNLDSYRLNALPLETPILAKHARLLYNDIEQANIGYRRLVSGIIVPVSKRADYYA